MKRFVLVIVTIMQQGALAAPLQASGIRKLKRDVSLSMFVDEHLNEFGLKQVEKLLRGDTIMVVHNDPPKIFTWSFTEYPEDELLQAVRHLSREELLRDLKEILPLKNIK